LSIPELFERMRRLGATAAGMTAKVFGVSENAGSIPTFSGISEAKRRGCHGFFEAFSNRIIVATDVGGYYEAE
jgi:chemotaxis receptor (MCP) glutamine deamidase CheD